MAFIRLEFPNDHTPLDLLLWNHFRKEVDGLVERTLLANPGLAALGAFPPRGTVVLVPEPGASDRAPAPLITLWSNGG